MTKPAGKVERVKALLVEYGFSNVGRNASNWVQFQRGDMVVSVGYRLVTVARFAKPGGETLRTEDTARLEELLREFVEQRALPIVMDPGPQPAGKVFALSERIPQRFRFRESADGAWIYGACFSVVSSLGERWEIRVAFCDCFAGGVFEADPWEVLGQVIGDVVAFEWIDNAYGWAGDSATL